MNNELYKQIIKDSPIGYAYHRTVCINDGIPCDYEFIEVNDAFKALTGLKSLDIIGKKITEILPGMSMPGFAWIHYCEDIAINGGKKELEQFSEFLNKTFKVNVYSPKKDYYITQFIDITEQKKAEAGIIEAEEFFELVFNTSPAADLITRLSDGLIINTNQGFTNLSGFTHDEIVGKSSLELNFYVNSTDRQIIIKELSEKGYCNNAEMVFRRKDGSVYTGLLSAKIFVLKGVTHISSNIRDITNRKMAEIILKASAEKYRLLIMNSHDIIYTLTPGGIFSFVSPSWTVLLGHPATQVVGQPYQQFVHPDDIAECMNFLKKVFETRQRQEGVEYRVHHNDGSWRWHTSSAVPLKDYSGEVIGYEGVARDITDRKRGEEALIVSEVRYRRLFETAKDGILILNAETGKIMNVNPFLIDMLGYSEEQIIEKAIWEIGSFKDIIANWDNFLELQQKGYIRYENLPLQTADGRKIAVEFVSNVYPVDHHMVIQCNIRDITDRKKLEAALAQEKKLFETTLISIADGVISCDNNGNVIFLNRVAERLTGWTQEAAIGKSIEEVFNVVDEVTRKQSDNIVKMVMDGGNINGLAIHNILISKDGIECPIENSAAPVIDINGETTGVVITLRDIAERKQAEKLISDSEEKFRTVFEQASVGICLVSLDRNFMSGNQKTCEILGYSAEELSNMSFIDITYSDDNAASQEVFSMMINNTIKTKSFEKRYIKKDGAIIWAELSVSLFCDSENKPRYFIVTVEDITERKKKEEEILYLNYHDGLTGLYNRTFFQEEQKRLNTQQQLPLSVIIGDINGLKLLNDALGHAEGDKLLIEMAKALGKCCRAEDILARTGGDEFCILLPKTNSQGAQLIIDRIKAACEELVNQTDKKVFYASIALGHATKTEIEEPFDNVLKVAEEYMYRRKLLEYKSLHSSIISSIKTTMFEKSNETEEHAERLAELSKILGRVLGLTDEELDKLELVSVLHDIGKISINKSILSKPDKLTKAEWFEIKKHPQVGYRITQAIPELKHISEYILCHHERWDGKGYPQGLIGEQIPLLSRILAVVDSYDAMTQDRSYRKAMSKEAAISEIEKNSGTQFDPEIAGSFIKKVLNKPDN
ncbi:MAG: PAS domain S-box protein [Clostridiaceae bacterium]|nr:PAS domain S-box protein [Clostridiaceae bacterium]